MDTIGVEGCVNKVTGKSPSVRCFRGLIFISNEGWCVAFLVRHVDLNRFGLETVAIE